MAAIRRYNEVPRSCACRRPYNSSRNPSLSFFRLPRFPQRATSDPSYLSPFSFPGCHYSALGQWTLPAGKRGPQAEGGGERAWWSQERCLARQKMPRKITYTSSSTVLTHRISTFVILSCTHRPSFVPGGMTVEFFGVEDNDNICHSRSRGGSGSSSAELEMIFDFYDDARLRDAM